MGKRVVDVEERLPWYQALPLGLQHFLSMFGATVLVPMLMGFSPSVSVMCSGIGTALYLVATKGKIPSYLGPSFSFVGPVVIASATAGVAGVGSAIVGAGLVFVVCALVVRKTGTRWIDRLIPTVVMAEIIFVIGCGLATTAVSEALTVPEGETLWQDARCGGGGLLRGRAVHVLREASAEYHPRVGRGSGGLRPFMCFRYGGLHPCG